MADRDRARHAIRPAAEQRHGGVTPLFRVARIREIVDGCVQPRFAANLQRGLQRLGVCLAVAWFVYWTCAWVIGAHASENYEQVAGEGISTTGWIILTPLFIAAAVLGVRWIVAAFRSP
jgi:hypothetical protein